MIYLRKLKKIYQKLFFGNNTIKSDRMGSSFKNSKQCWDQCLKFDRYFENSKHCCVKTMLGPMSEI